MKIQTFISAALLITNLQLITNNCTAQVYFNKEFTNDSIAWDLGAFVHEFSDTSGYLIVGSIPMLGYQNYLRFLRLNVNGDTLWSKFYRNRILAQGPTLGDYVNIGDTNFVLGGVYSPQSSDSVQINLFKIDANGNVLWDLLFGDAGKKTWAYDIKQTKTKGFIITGWTSGWGAGNAGKSFLLKVDSNGVEEWHKIYTVGLYSLASSVDTTNDGGYIISGGLNYNSSADIFVLRTDSLGIVQWVTIYGSPYPDWYSAYIKKYGANEYILAGGITVDFGNGLNSQTYLAKIDGQNGNVIWADTAGTDQSTYDEGFNSTPIILNSGAIVLVGDVDRTSNPGSGTLALLAKYSSNGTKLWERDFSKYGATNQHYFWDVHETFDKGFIVCGDLTDQSTPSNFKRLWVVKLDSMGCEVVNCNVGVEEEEVIAQNEVMVYPNPANNLLTIEINDDLYLVNSCVKLYNIDGKELINSSMSSTFNQVDISKYPSGIYFFQLLNSKKTFTGKLIIIH